MDIGRIIREIEVLPLEEPATEREIPREREPAPADPTPITEPAREPV